MRIKIGHYSPPDAKRCHVDASIAGRINIPKLYEFRDLRRADQRIILPSLWCLKDIYPSSVEGSIFPKKTTLRRIIPLVNKSEKPF